MAKIARKIGFTDTELKVVVFLTFTLFTGFAVKNFFLGKPQASDPENFDYSVQDSLFYYPPGENNSDSLLAIADKEVDYKQEVLNFNNRSFKKYTKKSLPAENSVNLNTASLEALMSLPGIGQKTAQSILDLREKMGRFRKVDDLLKVRGIGNTKLNNIKKYIFIE